MEGSGLEKALLVSKDEHGHLGVYHLECRGWPSGISGQWLDVKERIPERAHLGPLKVTVTLLTSGF